jgi:hypothetical protein
MCSLVFNNSFVWNIRMSLTQAQPLSQGPDMNSARVEKVTVNRWQLASWQLWSPGMQIRYSGAVTTT